MDSTFTLLAVEMAQQRLRACRAEERLRELQQMLDTLGITLWQTDRELRLMSSHGLVLAESYESRHIGEFFRDAYGMEEADAEPLAAHRDARAGRSVTLNLQHDSRQYAILVDPKRDDRGRVIGTVGMAVRLDAATTAAG